MITEKAFASSHHAFWHELLPMGEHYIRTTNLSLARFAEPITSRTSPRLHGVINELAFRLFVRATAASVRASELDAHVISEAVASANDFIARFRQHGRGPLPSLNADSIPEAIDLAERTATFFRQATTAPILPQPRFQGCGWLSECEGDALSREVLYEIKAGARPFRMLDVKQTLVYCALNFSAKSFEIASVCLVNPRHGTYFGESLNTLCELLAGRSAMDVLSEIVEYVSQSPSRDDA